MKDRRNKTYPSFSKPIHPNKSLGHLDLVDDDSMTTKRATSYGHPHQPQQRHRPPDVEEALSSMLWTPYERASNTDTSSEDEDEQLNRQLRKSKSQYDYTSLPTIPPSPTPPPPPTQAIVLPATANIVAYIPTPTTRLAASATAAPDNGSSCLLSAGSAYYTSEDLCDASVTTPLVPFPTNLMLAGNPTLLNADAMDSNATVVIPAIAVPIPQDDAQNNCYPNESTLAATSSSFASSLENHKNRFSYAPSYGRIPGLSKWWASSSSNNDNSRDTTPALDNGTTASALASAPGPPDAAAKQPPSYESLYSKQSHTAATAPTSALQRHSKHLKIFKPVLETLKANVTTIKQGRFSAITTSSTHSSNATAVTQSSHQDNTNTNATTQCGANHHSNASGNSCSHTAITGPHLVHSFTDNFLTEHCNRTQHVVALNVDNAHIINNNFNSNNLNCSITTIEESTEPAVQQHKQKQNETDEKTKQETTSDDDKDIHDQEQDEEEVEEGDEVKTPLIHQQQQLSSNHDHHDQNTKETNSVSQQTEMEEEEDDDDDDDECDQYENNNFINKVQQQNKESDRMNRQISVYAMNSPLHAHAVSVRESRVYTTYSPLVYCSNNQMVNGGVPLCEASVATISLTRSFEGNTTEYGGLTCYGNKDDDDVTTSGETFKTSFDNTKTNTTYELTPNKCLAELERLYAEFRASESLREKRLREIANSNAQQQTATEERSTSEIIDNMRLNVPASSVVSTTPDSDKVVGVMTEVQATKTGGDTKINPSTSSVFLTTTNSVTALTNPCQRTPSLTIQVNQNLCDLATNHINVNNNNNNKNNNNHSNSNNNNNISVDGENVVESSNAKIHLSQAIVHTMATNAGPSRPSTVIHNGVSVINCNYVNNINNNNNNNNNNKSITNLSDLASNTNTNLNLNLSHENPNLNLNANNFKSVRSDTNSSYSSSDANNPSGQNSSSRPYDSSVPKKSNNEKKFNNNNDGENLAHHTSLNTPNDNRNINASVNVIQVNGLSTTNNICTPLPSSSSPSRTYASTECQTDDVPSVQLRSPRNLPVNATQAAASNSSTLSSNQRDQRRRERRERRHLQHTASMMVAPTHSHHAQHAHVGRHGHLDRHSMPAPPLPPILHPPHMHPGLSHQTPHNVAAMLRPMLPDILHNHYPPPYSALPHQPPPPPPGTVMGASCNISNHPNGTAMASFGLGPPPPPPPGATMLGPPPPPPPPAGTTLLTSVISTVPLPGATPMLSDGRFTLPLPIIRRSPSERSGKGCCGQWFAGPPLRALIAVVALGGVACALGGAALGATGLAGPPSSHFTAALLMIGVGVVLVTVSGAAWRMTAPGGPPCLGLGSSVDLGRCGRRPCSRGGGAPQGLLYPEFQHRPPPPSYQASMQEYRLRLLLLDRDRQNGVVRGSSPPPTYRSHAGSLLRAPLTSTIRGVNGIGGSTGRADGSIGGSEYSFPPSYRSRNNTPGTISSERSIETEPSGRLLANEDIPEPLSVEQLSEYNSLQQRTRHARLPLSAAVTSTVTSGSTTTGTNAHKIRAEEKRNSLQMDKNCIITKKDSGSSDKKDDLVTIVTITPQSSDNSDMIENQNNTNHDLTHHGGSGGGSREQIEILAHL